MDGVIVVDKPEGWTSHDVVGKMRRLAGTKRIGHLGTLDPMATGVLPLVVERATRLAQFFVKNDKRYEAVIRFGYSTDSYDREGTPTSPAVDVDLKREDVERALEDFRGTLLQMPPPISAKKIGGVPAYKLARRNLPVELKAVEVSIFGLELVECGSCEIRVRVHCSAGTYLRSLAHDLGQKLGCGAFVQELRRTSSGDFQIEQARTVPELEELSKEGRIAEAVIPASKLLPEIPGEVVDALTVRQIRQGRDFRVSPFRVQRGAKYVKAISPEGDLVAMGEVKMPNLYHPILVL
ncbi:MAG: tRNA pseudouridine(55) synthase TruB [Bryobacteraceae bacterium]|nr:tRNA pseudouridine(55) synthase TruB [Bryobacteraceae bacterium]